MYVSDDIDYVKDTLFNDLKHHPYVDYVSRNDFCVAREDYDNLRGSGCPTCYKPYLSNWIRPNPQLILLIKAGSKSTLVMLYSILVILTV